MLSVQRSTDGSDARYSRSEVLPLGAKAYARAVPSKPSGIQVSISAATFESQASYVEIVRAILDGTFNTVGFFETRQGSGHLSRILVDLGDVGKTTSQLVDTTTIHRKLDH